MATEICIKLLTSHGKLLWAMQEKQHGYIGLNLFAYWFVPFRNTTEDAIATERANEFYLGW